jgi:hypothetical protein
LGTLFLASVGGVCGKVVGRVLISEALRVMGGVMSRGSELVLSDSEMESEERAS